MAGCAHYSWVVYFFLFLPLSPSGSPCSTSFLYALLAWTIRHTRYSILTKKSLSLTLTHHSTTSTHHYLIEETCMGLREEFFFLIPPRVIQRAFRKGGWRWRSKWCFCTRGITRGRRRSCQVARKANKSSEAEVWCNSWQEYIGWVWCFSYGIHRNGVQSFNYCGALLSNSLLLLDQSSSRYLRCDIIGDNIRAFLPKFQHNQVLKYALL